MSEKKIIIGSDHAGLTLKNSIAQYLQEIGYQVNDAGTHTKDSCDYPLIARKVANEIAQGNFRQGILVCGTGLGMSIAANKVKGIRAVAVSDTTSTKFSRLHNDANVLCFGERIVGDALAKDIVTIWLNTEFESGRHSKRVAMLEQN